MLNAHTALLLHARVHVGAKTRGQNEENKKAFLFLFMACCVGGFLLVAQTKCVLPCTFTGTSRFLKGVVMFLVSCMGIRCFSFF